MDIKSRQWTQRETRNVNEKSSLIYYMISDGEHFDLRFVMWEDDSEYKYKVIQNTENFQWGIKFIQWQLGKIKKYFLLLSTTQHFINKLSYYTNFKGRTVYAFTLKFSKYNIS